MCEALTLLLENIYIRFGSKLYRQIVGIPMGTNCVHLVADLFLFCYERGFMLSLSEDNQSDVIKAFSSTSRYLNDLLSIYNNIFDSMVNRMYPSELHLYKVNMSDTEASFLDLHVSISDGFVKTKIYDKREDFDFDIVNFPFLDVMFLVRHPMVFIFLNLFDLHECPVMLMTLILVIRFCQQTHSDKDIDIINFVRRFQNFIGGILT